MAVTYHYFLVLQATGRDAEYKRVGIGSINSHNGDLEWNEEDIATVTIV